MANPHSSSAALKLPEIRYFIASVGFFSFASRALAVVIGFQIYRLTGSALALGFLGLIEAIPAIALVLFGGHVADHFNRRRILLCRRKLLRNSLQWATYQTKVRRPR